MDGLTIMLIVLMWSVFLQTTIARVKAALIFASASVMHEVAFSNLDGLAYYGSAALFDLIVILLITAVPVTRLAINLQIISTASIILNCIGWVLWTLYLPPDVYNWAFIVLYAIGALALIGGGDDMGHGSMDRRRRCIRSDDRQGSASS